MVNGVLGGWLLACLVVDRLVDWMVRWLLAWLIWGRSGWTEGSAYSRFSWSAMGVLECPHLTRLPAVPVVAYLFQFAWVLIGFAKKLLRILC